MFGNSLTSVPSRSFAECSGFTGSLVLPRSVKTIGDYVFHVCANFNADYYVSSALADSVGTGAFSGCCTVSTPLSCIAGQYCGFETQDDVLPSCLACPVGHYKSLGEVCRSSLYGMNNYGSFMSNVLSAQVNRFCSQCPIGYINDEEGGVKCRRCPGATYGSSVGAASIEDCVSCSNGTHAAPGSSFCSICPAGRYSLENSSSCTRCPPDTYSVVMSFFCEPCM